MFMHSQSSEWTSTLLHDNTGPVGPVQAVPRCHGPVLIHSVVFSVLLTPRLGGGGSPSPSSAWRRQAIILSPALLSAGQSEWARWAHTGQTGGTMVPNAQTCQRYHTHPPRARARLPPPQSPHPVPSPGSPYLCVPPRSPARVEKTFNTTADQQRCLTAHGAAHTGTTSESLPAAPQRPGPHTTAHPYSSPRRGLVEGAGETARATVQTLRRR